MIDLGDLDGKSIEVLEAVYENGGEATTSEIKEYTGIEKNAIIHYRMEKLEDLGLGETGHEEVGGNRLPLKTVALTEEGERQVQGGLFEEETPTVVERMDRLERQFGRVLDELQGVKDEFEMWRYDEESGEEIEPGDLVDVVSREDVAEIEERLAALEEVDNDVYEGRGLPIKGKWLANVESVDASGGRGVHQLRGVEILNALESLEDRVAALEGEQ